MGWFTAGSPVSRREGNSDERRDCLVKPRLATALRLAVSAGLITILLKRIDFTPLRENLHNVRPTFYLLALSLMAAYLWVQGIVLKLLLGSRGWPVRVRDIVRELAISNLFGVFLPGGVGPDVVLFFNLCRGTTKKSDVLNVVAFARLATLAAAVLLAFGISLTSRSPLPGLTPLFGLVLLGAALVFVTLTSHSFGRLAKSLLGFLKRHPFTRLFYQAAANMAEAGRDRRLLLATAPFLLLAALLRAVMDYSLALALGYHLPLPYFLVFSPLITLAVFAPITLAGIGVRESTYVALLGAAGVPAAGGFTVSILSFSLTLWVCLVGAVLYILRRRGRDIPSVPGAGVA
jgi:uncharacterized membrane protein YbhN (UPF0104 family)